MAPFIMAPSNTRVVRRSNAVAGYPYSKEFRYREAMGFGEGVAARAKATGMTAGMGAFGAAMGFGPTRAGIGKVLPKAGEGPSPRSARPAGSRWRSTAGHLRASTSCRRCRPRATRLRGDVGHAGGVRAPAGLRRSGDARPRRGVDARDRDWDSPLVERLRSAGFTFEAGRAPVDEEPQDGDAAEGSSMQDDPANA